MFRLLFFIVFSSVFLLSGCFDDSTVAPVVNGWYQKNAASNFYVVQSGDTIYSIAFAFGLDYRALAAVNDLQPPYRLIAGHRLKMTHTPAGATRQRPAAASYHRQNVFPRASQTKLMTNWSWPTKGRVIQVFSRKPDGHPGISIAGVLGQPIRATANGRVVYSGDGIRGYGNLIIIKHSDQYLSAYAFNQQNLVSVGDAVKAGQMIARMGQDDAGHTILYFEIRYDGVPMNPMGFLK